MKVRRSRKVHVTKMFAICILFSLIVLLQSAIPVATPQSTNIFHIIALMLDCFDFDHNILFKQFDIHVLTVASGIFRNIMHFYNTYVDLIPVRCR